MANCCENKSCEIDAMRAQHGWVLWLVLALNAVLFFVEGAAGISAHSTALQADALDMLGDALVYGFSLFVLARSTRWQTRAALVKGCFMLTFGLAVLGQAVHQVLHPVLPAAGTMGAVGALALLANLVCFGLLYRHRGVNLNMRSTWLCSRNDLIANGAVLLTAGAGQLLASRWPDILVGTGIAALFLWSALDVLREAGRVLRVPAVVQAVNLRRPRTGVDGPA